MNLPNLNFKETFHNFESLAAFKTFVVNNVQKVSAETFGWIAVLILHAAVIPSLLAVMSGLTDKLPPVDLILLVWSGLTLLFIKAAIQRDFLNLITIGLGFVAQSMLMALIFFK
jgi:hypothetical protein